MPLRALLLVLILAVTVGMACPDDSTVLQPPPDGTIQGTVTVEGEPLAGVMIYVSSAESDGSMATTAADGTYSLEATGTTLTVNVTGLPEDIHEPEPEYVEFRSEGATATADFDCDYVRSSGIHGWVEVGEEGVEGVTVTLAGVEAGTATTDATGAYLFTNLRRGTYTVTLSNVPAGIEFQSTSTSATVAFDENKNVDFIGTPADPRVAIVAVKDADGTDIPAEAPFQGLADAYIEAFPQSFEPSRVVLMVDGTEIRTVAPPTEPGETLSVKTRTDRLQGSTPETEVLPEGLTLDGYQKMGQFENGSHSLTARMYFEDHDPVDSEPFIMTFANPDVVIVSVLDPDGGVESSGVLWFGGRDVGIAATPVSYTGTTVGEVEVGVTPGPQTARSGGSLALDSYVGQQQPFTFTFLQADNDGGAEDALGDGADGPGGSGSEVTVTRVADDAGTDVTDQFEARPLVDFFVDFMWPAFSNATFVVGDRWLCCFPYFTGSEQDQTYPFRIAGVTDEGVGANTMDPGSSYTIDVVDGSGSVLFQDIEYTYELPENPIGGVQMFAQCRLIKDLLGNIIPAELMPACKSVEFAIDRGGPIIEAPNDEPPPEYSGSAIPLTVTDRKLPAGIDPESDGSGIDTENCTESCKSITVTVLSGPAGAPATLPVRTSASQLSGTYSATISVMNDPGGHDPSIFNASGSYPPTLAMQLQVTVLGLAIGVTGTNPWINVLGSFTSGQTSDEFEATGSGTVGGVENVGVSLSGGLYLEGGWAGSGGIYAEYTMGTGGELPGGQPITYMVEATPDAGPYDTSQLEIALPDDLPDGTYTVRIDAADKAWVAPNTSSVEFTFVVNRGG